MLILISETVESVEQGRELSFHGDWPASCLSVVGVFMLHSVLTALATAAIA